MKELPCISRTTKLLTLGMFMFLCLTCTKDESSSEEPEEILDLVGTWDIDMVKTHFTIDPNDSHGLRKEGGLVGKQIGSFTLDKQNSAGQETFMESVTIDLEHARCIGTNFLKTFNLFSFGNVKDNKIQDAKAGDSGHPGFMMSDLIRMNFSCDFTSFTDVDGKFIISWRLPSSSTPNLCDETITFTAIKRE